MAKEIVISADKAHGTTRIALVENGELAELHVETPQHERTLGDVMLGKVKKVMPSIRAAFVDIGQQQDAFLHYSDLTDNLPQLLAFSEQDKPEIASIRIKQRIRLGRVKRHRVRQRPRKGKGRTFEQALDHLFGHRRRAHAPRPHAVGKKARLPAIATTDRPEECLKRDQRIIVKIVKEPISTKGSRVSTDISLAGRFLVLVPLADYVAVSKKISSYKERRRLRALARSLVPDGFGVIVRTQAEGKKARDLDTDLRLLVEKWRKIEEKLVGKPRPPLTLHEDVNMVSSVIRDLFSDDYDRILIDDPKVYRNVKSYVQAVAPHMAESVHLYTGSKPVFEATGLNNAVRTAFESRVNLPCGGYLFFERTEAMHVVDVNSGRSGKGMSQEENSLRVNLEAARAIARQMRLRDLGGIMCVDFIDMRDEKNRRKVYDEFKKEFRHDRAVTKLLPMSDFGVLQITRQRLRPALTTLHTLEEVAGDGGTEAGEAPDLPPGKASDAPLPVEVAARPAPRPERERRESRLREAPDALVTRMGQHVADYKAGGGKSPLILRVHPFLGAFLNRRVPNWPTRWSFRHLVRIRVEEDEGLHPFEFVFVPGAGAEAAPLPAPTGAPAPPPRPEQTPAPAAAPAAPASAAPPAPERGRAQAPAAPARTARPRETGEPLREHKPRRGGASNRAERGEDKSSADARPRRPRGERKPAATPAEGAAPEAAPKPPRSRRSKKPAPENPAPSAPEAEAPAAAAPADNGTPSDEPKKRRRRRGGRNRRRKGGSESAPPGGEASAGNAAEN